MVTFPWQSDCKWVNDIPAYLLLCRLELALTYRFHVFEGDSIKHIPWVYERSWRTNSGAEWNRWRVQNISKTFRLIAYNCFLSWVENKTWQFVVYSWNVQQSVCLVVWMQTQLRSQSVAVVIVSNVVKWS